jgi:copper chaperone NosL
MKLFAKSASILVGIAGMVWLTACTVEPRKINYGQEACHTCKMTLAERNFGGELVTRKGKVFVFDDLNCLLSFYNSLNGANELAHTLVIDYENPGAFLNAGETFFVKSNALRSPMAGNVAAFSTYDGAIEFKREKGGIILGWAEATTQFK